MKNLIYHLGIIALHLAVFTLAILVWVMNWDSAKYNDTTYRRATTGVAVGSLGLGALMGVATFVLIGKKAFD